MSVTVNIMSNKEGEIKKFLNEILNRGSDVDNGIVEWIYIYRDMRQALKIVNTVSENYHNYDVSLWIQFDDDDIIKVTNDNIEVIKEKIQDKMNILGNVK